MVKMDRGDVMDLMQHEPIDFSYEVLHQKNLISVGQVSAQCCDGSRRWLQG